MSTTAISINIASFFIITPVLFIVLIYFSKKTRNKILVLGLEMQLLDFCLLSYFVFEHCFYYNFLFPSYLSLKLCFQIAQNYQVYKINTDILRVIRAKNSKKTNLIPEMLVLVAGGGASILRICIFGFGKTEDNYLYARKEQDLIFFSLLNILYFFTGIYSLKAVRQGKAYLKQLKGKKIKFAFRTVYLLSLLVVSGMVYADFLKTSNWVIKVLTGFFFLDLFLEKLIDFTEARAMDFIKYKEDNPLLRFILCVDPEIDEDTILLRHTNKLPLIMDIYDFDDESEVIDFLNVYINSLSFALKQSFTTLGDEMSLLFTRDSEYSSSLEETIANKHKDRTGRRRWFGTDSQGNFAERTQQFFFDKSDSDKIMLQAVMLNLFEDTDLQQFIECGDEMEDNWTKVLNENSGIFSYLSDGSLKNKRNLTFRSKNKKFVVEICGLAVLKGNFLERYMERTRESSFMPKIMGVFKVKFMENDVHAVIVTENIVTEELMRKEITLWQQASVGAEECIVGSTSAPTDNLIDSAGVVVDSGFCPQLLSYNTFVDILKKDFEFLRSARCAGVVFSFLYCEMGSIKVNKGENTTLLGDSVIAAQKSFEAPSFNVSKNISAIQEQATELDFGSNTINDIIEGNDKNFEGINNDLRCVLSFGFDNVFGEKFILDHPSFYAKIQDKVTSMFKETSFTETF